jgi:hypothetical protein
MDLHLVDVEIPDGLNLILGQAHFIKTVDDLYQALAASAPGLRFGIAFCEASGARLVRRAGNDAALVERAVDAARAVAAGHAFVVYLGDTPSTSSTPSSRYPRSAGSSARPRTRSRSWSPRAREGAACSG